MHFKRPDGLEFPKIYNRFNIKQENNETIEYLIQDLPKERFKDALELIKLDYLPEESLCGAKEIHKDPESTKFLCAIWMDIMKQNLSIVCFKNDGCDEIIAVNFLAVHSQSDPKLDIKVSKSNNLLARSIEQQAQESSDTKCQIFLNSAPE